MPTLLDTVVVQPTTKTVMQQSTIETLFTQVFASGWTRERLTIIWHAGEPLVVPISFYETAFQKIDKLRPATLRLRHSIQTNGMLITREWCELFKKWDAGVGVSIDGPKRLHDAHRVTRTGYGTFYKTIAGICVLRQENVRFHVISVYRTPETRIDLPAAHRPDLIGRVMGVEQAHRRTVWREISMFRKIHARAAGCADQLRGLSVIHA